MVPMIGKCSLSLSKSQLSIYCFLQARNFTFKFTYTALLWVLDTVRGMQQYSPLLQAIYKLEKAQLVYIGLGNPSSASFFFFYIIRLHLLDPLASLFTNDNLNYKFISFKIKICNQKKCSAGKLNHLNNIS